MNTKGLVATIAGVILSAVLVAMGSLWSQVGDHEARIRVVESKMDLALELLRSIREEIKEDR